MTTNPERKNSTSLGFEPGSILVFQDLHATDAATSSRHSFSTLQPRDSSDCKATSANTYYHCFLVQHFLCTSSTSRNHWWLKHYHIPNDSPTIKDTSLQVRSIRKFTVCKYIVVSLTIHKYMYLRQQTYHCITQEWPLHFKWCIFCTSRNQLQLFICCPVSPASSV